MSHPAVTITIPGPARTGDADALLAGTAAKPGLWCTFCGCSLRAAKQLLASDRAPGVYICDACVELAAEAIAAARRGEGGT